jgi:protoheme IX farnesyltransferase
MNTWIGSVVGAIPPVMGYAAASNGMCQHKVTYILISIFTMILLCAGALYAVDPLVVSAILFLWQFPHFFALSWMYRDDYSKGQFVMVSSSDPDGRRTASYIQEYAIYLTALLYVTTMFGITSYMFAIEGSVVNAYLMYRT